MAYAFSPGRCGGDPANLTSPVQDIANFLLVRGPYAWLGHGWLGCSRDYEVCVCVCVFPLRDGVCVIWRVIVQTHGYVALSVSFDE